MATKYRPSPAVIAARKAAMDAVAAGGRRQTKAQKARATALLRKAYEAEVAENPTLRAEVAALELARKVANGRPVMIG